MFVGRRAAGLVFLLALTAALFAPASIRAQTPEPGDKIKITLHDGNEVIGELLGIVDSGYRIRFGEMEMLVAYPSVKTIEVLVEDALLDEMRPSTGAAPAPEPPESAPPRGAISGQPGDGRAPDELAPPPVATPPPPRTDNRVASKGRPPKPQSRGTGLMVGGFIMLGVGTAVAVTSGVVWSNETEDDLLFDDEDLGYAALVVGGSVVATAGLVMGITGVVLKTVSGARRRRWERRYGAGSASLPVPSLDLTVAPTFGPGGVRGMSLVGRF